MLKYAGINSLLLTCSNTLVIIKIVLAYDVYSIAIWWMN